MIHAHTYKQSDSVWTIFGNNLHQFIYTIRLNRSRNPDFLSHFDSFFAFNFMAYGTVCITVVFFLPLHLSFFHLISLHVNFQLFFSTFFLTLFRIESNRMWKERTKKKMGIVLHAGNITTGATYTPLLLSMDFCIHLFGTYYGNANGDVWVVAQQTLSFMNFASQHNHNQINETKCVAECL